MYIVKDIKKNKKKLQQLSANKFSWDVKKPKALSMLEGRGGGSLKACKNYVFSETGKEDATAVRNEHKTVIVHADSDQREKNPRLRELRF